MHLLDKKQNDVSKIIMLRNTAIKLANDVLKLLNNIIPCHAKVYLQ
jgi:hypothetical protein